MAPLKVLQININRCKAAHDILEHFLKENRIDLVVITEPNKKIATTSDFITDLDIDVAIKIVNKNIGFNKSHIDSGIVMIDTDSIQILGGYFSPNRSNDEFEKYIEVIESVMRTYQKCIIAADLNAHSVEWGCQVTDHRGRIVEDFMASNSMIVANEGNTATFDINNRSSIVDVTLVPEHQFHKLTGWKVLDTETLSDHKYVYFEFDSSENGTQHLCSSISGRFDSRTMKVEKFISLVEGIKTPIETAAELDLAIQDICCKTMRKTGSGNKKAVYWWNDEIKTFRNHCNQLRRIKCRVRRSRKYSEEEKEMCLQEYKESRKRLKKAIKEAKEGKWKEVINDIENDVWGTGYKIVQKKFQPRPPNLGKNLKAKTMEYLFPKKEYISENAGSDEEDEIEIPVTEEELLQACDKLRPKKAPGPDGVPAEAVKLFTKHQPKIVCQVFDKLFKVGEYPASWKTSKLVLLRKGNKPLTEPTSFRPICLLDSIGKLYEQVISERLKQALKCYGDLNKNQFGFRKGRSTVMAINEVTKIAKREMKVTLKKRKLCALVLLDIKNAFNSASWCWIKKELKACKVPKYLRKIIDSYLSERSIIDSNGELWKMTCGVPQGSVLGPLLWNIMYDGVLKLTLPQGCKTVAYADDLALIAVEKTEYELERIVNRSLERIKKFLDERELQLSVEKTEAILLVGRKKHRDMFFSLGGEIITPKKEIKYLGVVLDEKLKFKNHLKYVINRATEVTKNLTRLMPRKGGCTETKRRMLCTVADSIVLYGCEVWKEALDVKENMKLLNQLQRTQCLKICRAYRTVGVETARLIASVTPLDLKLKERIARGQSKKDIEVQTFSEWQNRWNNYGGSPWTHKLFEFVAIKDWKERKHGHLNYYLTQFLTGHGCFQKYLHGINRAENEQCLYCGYYEDDAQHTVLECQKWITERSNTERIVKATLSSDNILKLMLESEEKWSAIVKLIITIMAAKETDGRRREKEALE